MSLVFYLSLDYGDDGQGIMDNVCKTSGSCCIARFVSLIYMIDGASRE